MKSINDLAQQLANTVNVQTEKVLALQLVKGNHLVCGH